MLTDEEKKEFLEDAYSFKRKSEFRRISQKKYELFMKNGEVDMEKVISFIENFTKFITIKYPNHKIKAEKNVL